MSWGTGRAMAARFDTLVLDVDGTLVDSNYHHTLAWSRAFAAAGESVPLWRIHRSIGMGGERLVARLLGEQRAAEVGEKVQARWKEEADALLPEAGALPYAREFLDRIGRHDVRLVLATSGKPDHLKLALEQLGEAADRQIDEVTSSADTDSKPAPDLIEKAIADVSGSAALVVGDSCWDAEASRRAGVPMVGVLTGGFGEQELLDAGAELVEPGLAELSDRLDTMLSASGR